LNKVDVSFQRIIREREGIAKTTLESFGIAEGTALDMAAAYMVTWEHRWTFYG
jgi:hypothetical protein